MTQKISSCDHHSRHLLFFSNDDIDHMLRWMCGHTRKDRIRNEVIRDRVGVAPIEEIWLLIGWHGNQQSMCPDLDLFFYLLAHSTSFCLGFISSLPQLAWDKRLGGCCICTVADPPCHRCPTVSSSEHFCFHSPQTFSYQSQNSSDLFFLQNIPVVQHATHSKNNISRVLRHFPLKTSSISFYDKFHNTPAVPIMFTTRVISYPKFWQKSYRFSALFPIPNTPAAPIMFTTRVISYPF
jgi:hypothetical protein